MTREEIAIVKNAGLGFAIPYLHNGQPHDYMPDFIIRLKTEPPIHLILETRREKGTGYFLIETPTARMLETLRAANSGAARTATAISR